MSADSLKQAVAKAGAELARDGMIVGLGSGSTLALVIAEIGRRVREEKLNIIGVPTSFQSRQLAIEHGIRLRDMSDVERIDLAIDGADEVDPQGRLIKGAGAAHVQEKIVAAAAERFAVVVDEGKVVKRLGERFSFPVEMAPPAMSFVMKRLGEMGLSPKWRETTGKLGPVVSDNGNPITDAKLSPHHDPDALNQQICQIPGVLGHGLFIGLATEVLIARSTPSGLSIERRTHSRL